MGEHKDGGDNFDNGFDNENKKNENGDRYDSYRVFDDPEDDRIMEAALSTASRQPRKRSEFDRALNHAEIRGSSSGSFTVGERGANDIVSTTKITVLDDGEEVSTTNSYRSFGHSRDEEPLSPLARTEVSLVSKEAIDLAIAEAEEMSSPTREPSGRWSRGALATGETLDSPPPPPPPRPVRIRVGMKSSSPNSNDGTQNHQQLPPPPPSRGDGRGNTGTVPPAPSSATVSLSSSSAAKPRSRLTQEDLDAGVLPDVLMSMRQTIESLTLFDSDMMRLAGSGRVGRRYGPGGDTYDEDEDVRETKESLRRSFQQSISAAVLVSLAHKRYERRRLAAMEIEKVVRSLVQGRELERVRAILLLLSDDYVRSTSEDARKGGVVALAASAIGLKKANASDPVASECRDLILASVVHACQDHSTRVRYYATESLFNVVKVIPSLAVQHFFILFEILRSLYADVDPDVRSGAELLDKKLKEVIVTAINSGQFTADACVPLFARFVRMRNKPTKRLTLTWLCEFSEKLIGAPILEFLHLFLGGVFAMAADPNASIRELSLGFLQSALPKLLETNEDFEYHGDGEGGSSFARVEFDKILQGLVLTMEYLIKLTPPGCDTTPLSPSSM